MAYHSWGGSVSGGAAALPLSNLITYVKLRHVMTKLDIVDGLFENCNKLVLQF